MSDGPSKLLPFEKRWRLYLSRGSRSLRDGDFAAAAAAFEMAYQEAPDEPQVLLALGRERQRQGRYEEAEPLLRTAFDKQPTATTGVILARLLGLHLRRKQEAFEIIHRTLDTCPEGATSAPLQVIRGELLLDEGAFAEARAAFGLAIDDPVTCQSARAGLARTYNAEGIALSEKGEYEPAFFAFKRAADLEPDWSGPYVNLGVVFGYLGKAAKAAEAYAAALERDPANPVAYFNLGTAQQRLGHHRQAVRTFEDLLQLAPDYPHVRGSLANVLGELKEFDRAIALLLEELEIDNTCVSCWTSLGLAYICAGNPERGEQCLHKALELDPGYFNAIRNLATLYVTQGRHDEAERLLRDALHLDPHRTSQLIASDRQLEIFSKDLL